MADDNKTLRKKREITPYIRAVIDKLMELGPDAAKLEYYDNDRASRRLKQTFVDIRDNELLALHRKILSIREEINSKYNKSKKNRNHEQSETV